MKLFSVTGKKRNPARELFLIFLMGIAAFWGSARYNVFERFVVFSRIHESWELDEVLVFLSGLFFALLYFSIRRWRESVSSERELINRNKTLENTLAEIRRLRGILPICASCKKIRDDSGYWHQVETYLHDHSEAEFSHSICPDCLKRLYPEFIEAESFPGENKFRQ
jgi:hypothetical protein